MGRNRAGSMYTLEVGNDQSGDNYLLALAHSYLRLLEKLGEIDSDEVMDAILDAITVYDQVSKTVDRKVQAQRAREQGERDELARKHEIAAKVECPTCGASPGESCMTSGPSGARNKLGIHDHAPRYRLATGLITPRNQDR